MTYEYTYLWWEGSTTSNVGNVDRTNPPIGEEVIDKINSLAIEGWEVDQLTAAPLTTGYMSPGGRLGTVGFTDKVHYLTILRRPREE